jgi:type IV pilus assembly protein PilA
VVHRARRDGAREDGFSFIELLVVVLIVGILAAIAIPSFLSQTSKAYDASAKELVRTAETTADSIATDSRGSYANVTTSALSTAETAIATSSTSAANSAWLVAASGNSDSYVVTVEAASTSELFSVVDDAGTISLVCGKAGAWTAPVANSPASATGVAAFTRTGGTSGGCVNGSW